MIQVDLSLAKVFALASSDWNPGLNVFPPSATRCKYFSKEEASLTMIRLYTTPLRAAWASVCWKHSSYQPWIVQVEARNTMTVYRKAASSEVYWTPTIPADCILAAATWFDWATSWPNELQSHLRPIQDFLNPKGG